jgi:hypothetical protein
VSRSTGRARATVPTSLTAHRSRPPLTASCLPRHLHIPVHRPCASRCTYIPVGIKKPRLAEGLNAFQRRRSRYCCAMKESVLKWILIVPDARRIHFTTDTPGVIQQSYRRRDRNLEHFVNHGSDYLEKVFFRDTGHTGKKNPNPDLTKGEVFKRVADVCRHVFSIPGTLLGKRRLTYLAAS